MKHTNSENNRTYFPSDVRQQEIVGTEVHDGLEAGAKGVLDIGHWQVGRNGLREADRLQTRPRLAAPDLDLSVLICSRQGELPELSAVAEVKQRLVDASGMHLLFIMTDCLPRCPSAHWRTLLSMNRPQSTCQKASSITYCCFPLNLLRHGILVIVQEEET